jgi:hypothetical protein
MKTPRDHECAAQCWCVTAMVPRPPLFVHTRRGGPRWAWSPTESFLGVKPLAQRSLPRCLLAVCANVGWPRSPAPLGGDCAPSSATRGQNDLVPPRGLLFLRVDCLGMVPPPSLEF